MPILFDIESGQPYEVSQEYYDQYNEWMAKVYEAVRPKESDRYQGQVLVYGSVGLDSHEQYYNELFYNPSAYETAPAESDIATKTVRYFIPSWQDRADLDNVRNASLSADDESCV